MTSFPFFLAERKCAVCGCENLSVLENHHLSYDPERIVILCANCHTRIHKNPIFKKNTEELLKLKSYTVNRLERTKELILFDRKRKKIKLGKVLEDLTPVSEPYVKTYFRRTN